MEKQAISEKAVQITLRLGKKQHAKLSEKAKEMNISLNSLISMLNELGLHVLEGRFTINHQD